MVSRRHGYYPVSHADVFYILHDIIWCLKDMFITRSVLLMFIQCIGASMRACYNLVSHKHVYFPVSHADVDLARVFLLSC